jgi:hypothetical protein
MGVTKKNTSPGDGIEVGRLDNVVDAAWPVNLGQQ